MRSLAILVVLLAASLSAGASAQDTPRCTEVRPGFVQCSETSIVGRQPSAYFLLGRTRDRYEPPPLERPSAAREVARSVQARPF